MRLIIIACIFIPLLAGCQAESSEPTPPAEAPEETIPFRKDGVLDFVRGDDTLLTIDIEIADNDSTIERGMMQRTSMPDLSGMLFLMPSEDIQGFWMSNTKISLDIIFANESGEIVHIAKYTTPLSPESVSSVYPASLVLEVIAGFTDSHGIIEGDEIDWRRD